MTRDEIIEFIQQRWPLWCRCICRECPDGTMCLLCGHAHEPKRDLPALTVNN